MNATKDQILQAIEAWIRQRPGLAPGNYGSLQGYRAELRRIGRQKEDAEALLAAVGCRPGVTAEMLAEAFRGAYSGRLSLHDETDGARAGAVRLDYCTGQYWPTEYRAAACAVLADALWSYIRSTCPETLPECISLGSWIRANAMLMLGKSLASRWMDYDARTGAEWRAYCKQLARATRAARAAA